MAIQIHNAINRLEVNYSPPRVGNAPTLTHINSVPLILISHLGGE